jgi:hypothetical protein
LVILFFDYNYNLRDQAFFQHCLYLNGLGYEMAQKTGRTPSLSSFFLAEKLQIIRLPSSVIWAPRDPIGAAG